MRYRRTLLAIGLAATAIGVAAPTTIAPATPVAASTTVRPYCGFYWGSLLKQHTPTAVAPLVNVRAGRHACFERLVLDMSGKADGYRVEYVTQAHLRGGARLLIMAFAPAHDDDYRPTYRPANPAEMVNVSGWRTFRQVTWGDTYEGETRISLGVRARLPFRVFTLDGPGTGSRIVIDVAHRW